MASWLGSASFVLFSVLFGCLFGFGLAASLQGIKNSRREKAEKKNKEE